MEEEERKEITLHLHGGKFAALWYLVKARWMSRSFDVPSHHSLAGSCGLPTLQKPKFPVGTAIQGVAGE